jgi:hypothetical protein
MPYQCALRHPNDLSVNMAIISLLFGSIWTSIVSIVALYVAGKAFYELLLSPLSHIPGPWYAVVSDLWLTTHTLRLRQCRAIQELFEDYGPIVRVGPNKVVFCDAASNKLVYMSPKFDKGTFYKNFTTCVVSSS